MKRKIINFKEACARLKKDPKPSGIQAYKSAYLEALKNINDPIYMRSIILRLKAEWGSSYFSS
jgi:hypothetical protein